MRTNFVSCFLNLSTDGGIICEFSVFRKCLYYHVSVCVEQKESLCQDELLWTNEFSSAVFTLGVIRILITFRKFNNC